MTLSKVVFPAPLAPIRDTISPRLDMEGDVPQDLDFSVKSIDVLYFKHKKIFTAELAENAEFQSNRTKPQRIFTREPRRRKFSN